MSESDRAELAEIIVWVKVTKKSDYGSQVCFNYTYLILKTLFIILYRKTYVKFKYFLLEKAKYIFLLQNTRLKEKVFKKVR